MRKFSRLVSARKFRILKSSVSMVSILFAVTLLFSAPQASFAATFTVCPVGCNYTSPELAVNDVDVIAGDTIDVTTGIYLLSATMQVDKSLTILGNDSVFDATGLRAITVSGANTNFSLTNATIRNGQAGVETGGGAIRLFGGASVNVVNVIFENNQAEFGGAVYNTGSTFSANGAIFIGNRATAGNGGAVLTNGLGSTYLTNSIVDGNIASNAGGGVAVEGIDAINRSVSFLSNTTVSNNAALTPALIIDNITGGLTPSTNCGAGPYGQTFLAGAEAISAFSYRVRATGLGIPSELIVQGWLRKDGPTGPLLATTTATIPASAPSSEIVLVFELDHPIAMEPLATYAIETEIVGNYSVVTTLSPGSYPNGQNYSCSTTLNSGDYDFQIEGGTPGEGSGVHASLGAHAGVTNSTVSGNVGEGILATSDALIDARFATITNNSRIGAIADPIDPDVSGAGTVFITASILAGNGINDCNGEMTTSGYNLIGDNSNCVLGPVFNSTDIIGTNTTPVDPLLGPLQYNGGANDTHEIDENSPAFNAAGPALAGEPCFDYASDQRGITRPNGAACDIGAFEFAIPAGPLQTLINAAAPGGTINVPDGLYTEQITIGDGKTLQNLGSGVTIDVTNLGVSAIIATGDFTLIGIDVTGGNTSGNGGGIFANVAGTDITLTNAIFSFNNAAQDGGAIYLPNGTLSANNVAFLNNTASGNGGAIFGGAASMINISSSQLASNSAGASGGSIFNEGGLTVSNTTTNLSTAGDFGGGIYNGGTASLNVTGSTFSNNNAVDAGGAIAGTGTGAIDIRNSTLSGNTTAGNGGGINLTDGTAVLNNVTLAFNAASGLGGPFYGETGALISFSNSLLSGNTGGGSNCAALASLGYNLFQSAPCATQASDIIAEPLIDVLASNGGPTQTHALQAGSPAIDSGSPVPNFSQFNSNNIQLLQTQGGAALDAGTLFLADGTTFSGSAFVTNPIDPAVGFSATFQFRMTQGLNGGSDGITFTISDNPNVLGGVGGLLGIANYNGNGATGVVNGISVEFDTWVNGGGEGANDPGAQDHIGIDINGNLSSQALTVMGPYGTLSDDSVWTAWIDYDVTSNTIEVRASNDGLRPGLPTVSTVADIASLTGPTAYVGFTAGAGAPGFGDIAATHRILSFSFDTSCESTDQRGDPRPQGTGCDIGAFEGAPIPLVLGPVNLSANPIDQDLDNGTSYPGVINVPIIDIPIEKLTGDTFNAPSSAPLGSFPLGSFPIGSFDLRSSPIGSFPLGSFPIGSFPIGSFPLGSFPLSSLPLLTPGGWNAILNEFDELAGAPLQTVTLEKLMTLRNPLPDSIASIQLRDLAIDGSPLSSLSLPSLSLGDTTVAEFDEWAQNADPTSAGNICSTLSAADPGFADCSDSDTLLGLELKGAKVSALSLSSLPLGSFPIGSFPIGSFPIGSFPLGSFPIGSFPIGSFPIGSFPIGSFPLGSFPIGSFPIGSFDLLAAPIGSFPLGSFPIGSFPLGSFEIDGKTFCEFYDEKAIATGSATCAVLGINPATDSLADLVKELQLAYSGSSIGSTPLGSFPLGSFPIGSFPIGSFDLETLATPPLSELTLGGIDGCTIIADNSADTCDSLSLSDNSSLRDTANKYGGSLAASPLGSFPIGSFDVAGLPLGSFPIGSFYINGAPLGSFPLGSFDIIGSPLGSFPIGSFPIGSFEAVIDNTDDLCVSCLTLADAARAGAIKSSATLADLVLVPAYATTTLGEVLDAMTLAMLYGPPGTPGDPSTLGDIENTGNLTLGQLLIAMMLKTDFPWETIPLAQLDAQTFSADNFVEYAVDLELSGSGSSPISVAVTLADSFLYVNGSAIVDTLTIAEDFYSTAVNNPVISDNEDGTQTLTFNLVMDGFTSNTFRFAAVPPLALGKYQASASVMLAGDDPVAADASNGTLTVIPDPITDISDPALAFSTPKDVLTLGFISSRDDNDFYQVTPPAAGDRVSVFMSNPAGDNDLIMYEPLSTVEAKGQSAESAPLDSIPFEDDGVDYRGNVSEEPNALEDVNLLSSRLASISTNRGGLDESVSAIAGDNAPFTIQVSGYNGAVSEQPYTLRVKVTPRVASPQCTARNWPESQMSTVVAAGSWMPDTNAVFLVNGSRLASSDPGGTDAADAALSAINNLIHAPGITNGVVVDVSGIYGVAGAYSSWDANPCDVDAPNAIVNAITAYLETQRVGSPNLAYVTIVGSDEVIPFARKPDETSIANESTFAGEFNDNALYGALVTRHFLSDDSYGDIDPIPWLDRYLNVPELGVGRLVESAADIQTAAQNYLAFGGVLDPQTAVSAGYDFVADAAEDIDDTFNNYSTELGFSAVPALIDQPGVAEALAWTRSDFLSRTGLVPTEPGDPSAPVDLVSFNMHFDFDEALPSSGDANGNYTDNLISTADLAGADVAGGIWFTVGCHSGTNVPDVSVMGGAPSDDWAQAFSRLGAVYLAQNAFGLGDTEALALTERLMANFARNLNGSLTIGQAHAYAKQQYFAGLGLYGEYDYKALQAATLFGLPMYRYGNGAMVVDPLPPALPVAADPISGLASASWTLSDTAITKTVTASKGDLFSVDGEVQFVHFRPLQPIVRRDVTNPDGSTASGAFLTGLVTEDFAVADIAFARPVIDLGENEPEIETDEVVFPTAFTNIANYKAPPVGGGPFAPRDQLNVIVGQFTSPLDGGTHGTERLFRSVGAQVFYRPGSSASPAMMAAPASPTDFIRPEFDNVQASVVGNSGTRQVAFSIDVSDEGPVLRVTVLYLKSVTDGKGSWVLVDLVKGSGNTWTGGGPVEESAVASGQVDYMAQAVDGNGNVANSTFKGLFYVAEVLPPAPPPGGGPGSIGVSLTVVVNGEELPVNPGDWITAQPVDVTITDRDPDKAYEYSVDYNAFQPLTGTGFQIVGDGVHIVTVRETDGSNPVTFVILVDTTPPQVVITTPANDEFIVQGEVPAAEFDCLDAGSGITSCVGTVADGAPTPSANEGTHSFVVTAQDAAGKGPVVAETVYHVVKPLEVDGPVDPTSIDDPITLTASATDLAGFEETVTIDWGDGSPVELLDMSGGSVSAVVANHIYPEASVYQITVSVDYEGQFTQTSVIDFVVVYDASNGFVTGGGWIDSPTGAYTPNDSSDPDVTGKAHFGFVSKYKNGKTVPEGSTSFRFKAAGLDFDATSYEWMIISGARARYKGEGQVKGSSEIYEFQVTALDADILGAGISEDSFRIKIWKGQGGGEFVLYDNGRGADDATGNGGTTPIGGGSIQVHKAKKK